MAEPVIRERESLDPAEFCALFEACFGKTVDANYFQWKFEASPAGKALHVAAEADGRLAGLVNFMPSRFVLNGVEFFTCQGADVMVHPDFQRRGLLTSMTRLANERMVERGWRFIVNFTGEVLHSTYLKLGHHHLFDLQRWGTTYRVTTASRLLRRVLGANASPGLDATFDERFDDVWQRTSGGRGVAQVRDRAYLSWRYEQRPDRKYRLLTEEANGVLHGFAILRGPFLVDLWGEDDPAVVARLV